MTVAWVIQTSPTKLPKPQQDQLSAALKEEHYLAQQDAKAIEALQGEMGQIPLIQLPELPLDAHDLASLAALHTHFLDISSPKS